MMLSRRQFAGLALTTTAIALVATPTLAGSKARTGSLSGRKGYNVAGTVKVRKAGGKTTVAFEDNYQFDPNKNSPDIKIGFGNGENYVKGSKIHDKLTIKKGAASFEVPAGIDTDKYNELYI